VRMQRRLVQPRSSIFRSPWDTNSMSEQDLIDEVVDGTLNNNLSNEAEDTFVKISHEFQIVDRDSWLTHDDAFDRDELTYWENYFYVDEMVDFGFTEEQIDKWSKTESISEDEYKLFLRNWIKKLFETHNYNYVRDVFFHEVTHSDGRTCIALLSMREGGQCGWEFDDVYAGLFKTQDDATAYLKAGGLTDFHNDEELERYLTAVISQISKDDPLTEEEQQLADECVQTFFNFGYELHHQTKEKYPKSDHEEGWYWLTWNTPRKGMWLAGPFPTKEEADKDAREKVLPFDDPRREKESYDGVVPGASVRFSHGLRGTAETPLRDLEEEQQKVDEYNKAMEERRMGFVEYE
jgi:hypothetical protein